MQIPAYWEEARRQHRSRGQQVTVRRFGWSDVGQADADRHAGERADEALRAILNGAGLPRREPRVGYNGADGVPIREEILERAGSAVVTRNLYGARCLNTPDTFFADVDGPYAGGCSCLSLLIGSCAGLGLGVGFHHGSGGETMIGIALGLVTTVGLLVLWWGLMQLLFSLRGGAHGVMRRRVQRLVRKHPEWHLRLYRTPAGFRIATLHDLLDPRSEEVAAVFNLLGVDPVYALMCRKQNCFRARLTAKPWRIGMAEHIKPRSRAWPIEPHAMPARNDWVARYEQLARDYAACRFLESAGALHRIQPEAERVCEFHDRACRAEAELRLA